MIYHLYIIPLFVIFITKVRPIISIIEIVHNSAKSTLKVSPICVKTDVIFLSAIGSARAALRLYANDNIPSFIIGNMDIVMITNTPYKTYSIF